MSAAPTEGEPLPRLFARWAETLLEAPIPRERVATCDNCVMCPPPDASATDTYFRPDTKCCTFTPNLPNFLVGAALADDDPEAAAGRASLTARIAAGASVTPLGLGQPAVYRSLYGNAQAYGRSRALLCPHFDEAGGGRCGIWRHRDAVCATWFCKHVRGEVGHDFWRGALLRLLVHVEQSLAKWCVLELEVAPDTLEALASDPAWSDDPPDMTIAALEGRANPSARRLWGDWFGREAEFYRRCAELVETLGWDEVLAISGAEGRALASLTQHAFARLTNPSLPAALRAGPVQLLRTGASASILESYSPHDPIEVSNVVMALLPFFDGSPSESVQSFVKEQTGIELGTDLVQRLVDFGVLKPTSQT
ncbi:MAG TPA: hypothetical protein VGI95_12360 [Caulobacteraceae bacterium]